MIIERVTAADLELWQAFQGLIPQLTGNHPPPTLEELRALIGSDASLLLIARAEAGGAILGALTLIVYRVPTGVRARIEDVVVDGSARGQGIGEALTRRALDLAREAGADGVALTSNPRREAANQLYRKIGFQPWETNLYFYRFNP